MKQKITQVFLSYSRSDRKIAMEIAGRIRDAGIKVWIDEWELQSSDSIVEKIDYGVISSDILLVLLSPHSVKSAWVQKELSSALSRELNERAIVLIPALIKDCKIPAQIANRPYIDFRFNFNSAVNKLISNLKSKPSIDFTKLNWKRFEELIGDLLIELGFRIIRTREIRDSGFDFYANYHVEDPFGLKKTEVWVVEIKFYKEQRVSVSVLREIFFNMMQIKGINKGLIVTNGQLTSVAKEFLLEITSTSKIELRVLDGSELINLLMQYPVLVNKYFVADQI